MKLTAILVACLIVLIACQHSNTISTGGAVQNKLKPSGTTTRAAAYGPSTMRKKSHISLNHEVI
jgi:hypothetical protein